MKSAFLWFSVLASLAFGIPSKAFSQNRLSESTAALIAPLDSNQVYEYYTVGYAGLVSNNYQIFTRMVEEIPIEQLLNIVKHSENKVSRLYAFQAIFYKDEEILKSNKEEIFYCKDQMFTDTSIVGTLTGCNYIRKRVGAIAQTVLPYYTYVWEKERRKMRKIPLKITRHKDIE